MALIQFICVSLKYRLPGRVILLVLSVIFAHLVGTTLCAGGITDDERLLFSEGIWHREQRKLVSFITACSYTSERELPYGCQPSAKQSAMWMENTGRILDKNALLGLYTATGGADGSWRADDNWGQNTDPCWDHWYGVTCNENGRVIYLELPDNGLRGLLPDDLGDLTSLVRLDLSTTAQDYHQHDNKYKNTITGPLPSLAQASMIEEIEVSGNLITKLPDDLWKNGRTLRSLSASHNLIDALPTFLLRFLRLHTLELSNNRIGDAWVNEDFGKLVNLRFLHLQYNQLYGEVGSEMLGMTKNKVFDISHNPRLSGEIPMDIVINWPSQEYISVLNTSIVGYISSLCIDVPFCWRFMYDTHGDLSWTTQEEVSDIVLPTLRLAMERAGLPVDF